MDLQHNNDALANFLLDCSTNYTEYTAFSSDLANLIDKFRHLHDINATLHFDDSSLRALWGRRIETAQPLSSGDFENETSHYEQAEPAPRPPAPDGTTLRAAGDIPSAAIDVNSGPTLGVAAPEAEQVPLSSRRSQRQRKPKRFFDGDLTASVSQLVADTASDLDESSPPPSECSAAASASRVVPTTRAEEVWLSISQKRAREILDKRRTASKGTIEPGATIQHAPISGKSDETLATLTEDLYYMRLPGLYVRPPGCAPPRLTRGRPKLNFVCVFKLQALLELSWFKASPTLSHHDSLRKRSRGSGALGHSPKVKRRKTQHIPEDDDEMSYAAVGSRAAAAELIFIQERPIAVNGASKTQHRVSKPVLHREHAPAFTALPAQGDHSHSPSRLSPYNLSSVTTARPESLRTYPFPAASNVASVPEHQRVPLTAQNSRDFVPLHVPRNDRQSLRGKTEATKHIEPETRAPDVTVHEYNVIRSDDLDGAETLTPPFSDEAFWRECEQLVLNLMKQALGIYTGVQELWFPFITAWKQKHHEHQSVSPVVVGTAVQRLLSLKLLRLLTVTVQPPNTSSQSRDLILLPDVSLEDPRVHFFRHQIEQEFPNPYLPLNPLIEPALRPKNSSTSNGIARLATQHQRSAAVKPKQARKKNLDKDGKADSRSVIANGTTNVSNGNTILPSGKVSATRLEDNPTPQLPDVANSGRRTARKTAIKKMRTTKILPNAIGGHMGTSSRDLLSTEARQRIQQAKKTSADNTWVTNLPKSQQCTQAQPNYAWRVTAEEAQQALKMSANEMSVLTDGKIVFSSGMQSADDPPCDQSDFPITEPHTSDDPQHYGTVPLQKQSRVVPMLFGFQHVVTLTDPDQKSMASNGTISTEFSVKRKIKPRLDLNSDFQNELERAVPHNVQGILEQFPSSATVGKEGLDHATNPFYEIDRVAQWEEQHTQDLIQAREFAQPRFLNFFVGPQTFRHTSLESSESDTDVSTRASPLKRKRATAVKAGSITSPTPGATIGTTSNADDQFSIDLEGSPAMAKKQSKSIIYDEHLPRAVTIVIIVRTLMGGISRTVDWSTVDHLIRADSYLDRGEVKKRFEAVKRNWPDVLEDIQTNFEDVYLEAYEKGDLPLLKFSELKSYDWDRLLTWALSVIDLSHIPTKPDDRPPKSNLKVKKTQATLASEDHELKADVRIPPPSETRDALFSSVTNLSERDRQWAINPWFVPLTNHNPSSPPAPSTYDICFTHFRALMFMQPQTYDPSDASAALATFPDSILKAVQKSLSEQQLISASGGRRANGRTYNISMRVQRILHAGLRPDEDLAAATAHKLLTLDPAFRNTGWANFDYATADGETICVLNLIASGRVRLDVRLPDIGDGINSFVPASSSLREDESRERRDPYIPRVSPPPGQRRILSKWGFRDTDYRTRMLDRSWTTFPVRIYPSDTYEYGIPRPLTPSGFPTSELTPAYPPLSPEEARLPIWLDLFGRFSRDTWAGFAGTLSAALVVRPGANAEELAARFHGIAQGWEIEAAMQWGEQVGWVKKNGNGWVLGEYWWGVLGEGYVEEWKVKKENEKEKAIEGGKGREEEKEKEKPKARATRARGKGKEKGKSNG